MSARPLAPGVPAPDFALAATTSGREVRSGSGRPLVLVTYARNVAFAGDRLNRDVRERYSPSGELTVASVVDLSLMPPVFRPGPHGTRYVVPAGGGFLCHARPTRRTTS
jgi:hypothetical protein